MSKCAECGKPMHPLDAQRWLYCYFCNGRGGKGKKKPEHVRTLYDDWSAESIDRPNLDARRWGSEITDAIEEYEECDF